MIRFRTVVLLLLGLGAAVTLYVTIFAENRYPSTPPRPEETELTKAYTYYLLLFTEMERCGIPLNALESSMSRAIARAALSKAEKRRMLDTALAAAKNATLKDEGNDEPTCAEIARRHEIAQSMIKALP